MNTSAVRILEGEITGLTGKDVRFISELNSDLALARHVRVPLS